MYKGNNNGFTNMTYESRWLSTSDSCEVYHWAAGGTYHESYGAVTSVCGTKLCVIKP